MSRMVIPAVLFLSNCCILSHVQDVQRDSFFLLQNLYNPHDSIIKHNPKTPGNLSIIM